MNDSLFHWKKKVYCIVYLVIRLGEASATGGMSTRHRVTFFLCSLWLSPTAWEVESEELRTSNCSEEQHYVSNMPQLFVVSLNPEGKKLKVKKLKGERKQICPVTPFVRSTLHCECFLFWRLFHAQHHGLRSRCGDNWRHLSQGAGISRAIFLKKNLRFSSDLEHVTPPLHPFN